MSTDWLSPLARTLRPSWFDQHAPTQSATPPPVSSPEQLARYGAPVEGPTINAADYPEQFNLGVEASPEAGPAPPPVSSSELLGPSRSEQPSRPPAWLSTLQALQLGTPQAGPPAAQAPRGATIASAPDAEPSATPAPVSGPPASPPPVAPATLPSPAPPSAPPAPPTSEPPPVEPPARDFDPELVSKVGAQLAGFLSRTADVMAAGIEAVAPLVRAGDPLGTSDTPGPFTLGQTMRAVGVPYGLMTEGVEGAKKAWRGEPVKGLGDVIADKLGPGALPSVQSATGERIEVGRHALNVLGDPLNFADALAKGGLAVFGMAVLPAWNAQKLQKAARLDMAGRTRQARGLLTISSKLVRKNWAPEFVAAAKAAGHDERTIRDAIDTIDGLARAFEAQPRLLPQIPEKYLVGKQAGEIISSWKKNEDFIFTVDVDQTCARVRKYWESADALEQDLGRPLHPDELLVLGQEMRKRGDIPGCIFCYVEAGRRNQHFHAWKFATKEADELKTIVTDASDAKIFDWLVERDALRRKLGWTDIDEYSRQVVVKALRDANLAAGGDRARAVQQYDKWVSSAKGAQRTGHSYYDHEILRFGDETARDLEARAGIRWWSSTDLDPTQLLESVKAMWDATVRKIPAHAYTKEPFAVEIFGKTGMKLNMSVAVKWDPATGRFVSDTYNGMPLDVAMRLRKANPNAGTMLVAQDLDQLLWGLDNPDIDMIIPHHSGNWQGGVDKYGSFGLDNFSTGQHEHWVKGRERAGSVKDFAGEKLYFKHWLTKAKGDPRQAADLYLKFCKREGIVPKFGGGTFQDHLSNATLTLPDLSTHQNYYKVLADFARTDSPQAAIDASKINVRAMQEYLDEFVKRGGWADLEKPDAATVQATKEAIGRGDAAKLREREATLGAPHEPTPVNMIPADLLRGRSGVPQYARPAGMPAAPVLADTLPPASLYSPTARKMRAGVQAEREQLAGKQAKKAEKAAAARQARPLWEMTLDEFKAATDRGQIHGARPGHVAKGEEAARTPLRIGEVNKYAPEDIGYFYVRRRGGMVEIGYLEYLRDAILEGRKVPEEIVKPYPGLHKLWRKHRSPSARAIEHAERVHAQRAAERAAEPVVSPERAEEIRRTGQVTVKGPPRPLPPQPKIPETGIFTAVLTDDGGIYYTRVKPRESHLEVIDHLKIPRDRVVAWGELVDGVFQDFDWRAGLRSSRGARP